LLVVISPQAEQINKIERYISSATKRNVFNLQAAPFIEKERGAIMSLLGFEHWWVNKKGRTKEVRCFTSYFTSS